MPIRCFPVQQLKRGQSSNLCRQIKKGRGHGSRLNERQGGPVRLKHLLSRACSFAIVLGALSLCTLSERVSILHVCKMEAGHGKERAIIARTSHSWSVPFSRICFMTTSMSWLPNSLSRAECEAPSKGPCRSIF